MPPHSSRRRYLGARVLGGDGVASIAASAVGDGALFHSGNGSSGVTGGNAPRIDIHGAPLGRAWSVLAATARAGDTQLLLEHDPAAMGWAAGDELAIATTARGAGQLVSVASIGAALFWDLGAAGANASHDRPEDGEGADMAVDGTDATRWRSYDAAVAGATSTDWLLVRLHEPSSLRALTLQWDVPGRPASYSLHVRSGKLAAGCALPTASTAAAAASDASYGYTWTAAASNVAGSTGAWQTVALSGVGGSADVTAVRVWGNSAATAWGISLWEVRVLDGGGATLTPSGASASYEEGWNSAANAIDGDETGTRWATNGSPEANDWLLLTFVSPGVLPASVQLLWEGAYASSFDIEVGRSIAGPTAAIDASWSDGSDARYGRTDLDLDGCMRVSTLKTRPVWPRMAEACGCPGPDSLATEGDAWWRPWPN